MMDVRFDCKDLALAQFLPSCGSDDLASVCWLTQVGAGKSATLGRPDSQQHLLLLTHPPINTSLVTPSSIHTISFHYSAYQNGRQEEVPQR